MPRATLLFRVALVALVACVACGTASSTPAPAPTPPTTPSGTGPVAPGLAATRESLEAAAKGEPRNLTAPSPMSEQNPLFSPDGRTVVYTHDLEGGGGGLWSMGSDGAAPHQIFREPDTDAVNLPGSAWCKSQDRIAFTSDRDGSDHVWTIKPDGSGLTQVTKGPGRDYEPSWSPSCDTLAFQSDREGAWHIFLVAADGSNLRRLPLGDLEQWEPNFNPARNELVYQEKRGANWALLTHDIVSGVITPLTAGNDEDTDASFSPDGSWVVYSTNNGDADGAHVAVLEVANPKAGSIRMTRPGTKYDGAPSWAPDNRKIAFESTRSGNLDLWILDLP